MGSLSHWQIEELENMMHLSLGEDGLTQKFSKDDLNKIARLANEQGIDGADELVDNLEKSGEDASLTFRPQLNPRQRRDSNKDNAEQHEEATMSLMTEIVIAANSNMLEQLEAKKGAVKTLEQSMDQNVLPKNKAPSNTNSTPTPSPSPGKSGAQALDKNNSRWNDYLQARGCEYSGTNDASVVYSNELTEVGSSDMTAMRKDYSDNYATDRTIGGQAEDTASGDLANQGGYGQELTQQNDMENAASPLPSPLSTTPKPPGTPE